LRASKKLIFLILLIGVLLSPIVLPRVSVAVVSFTPQQGDHFSYSEVENLGNGTGSYVGYTEHTTLSGGETMNGVSESTVSASYEYSYTWSNSESSSTTASQSGNFTWSDSSFLYLDGTDDQQGYTDPSVWFAMSSSLPLDSTFTVLNTQMTIISRNYSFYLPTEGKTISTIFAQGGGSYSGSPDDDSYGTFNAKYTWNEYFDPTTGYIVGYTYSEQDLSPNGNGTGFGYTDDLYVTSTSYQLSVLSSGTPPTTSTSSSTISVSSSLPANSGFGQYIGYIVGLVIIVLIIGIIAYAFSRRGKGAKTLPQHSSTAVPPPPAVDLTPKEQPPVQQIVLKEVAKIKCKYCGALIDSTAETCPKCGAPQS
jgi:hypothetical protein